MKTIKLNDFEIEVLKKTIESDLKIFKFYRSKEVIKAMETIKEKMK